MSTRKGSPKISAFQDNFKNKKLHATFKLPDGDNFIRGTAPRLEKKDNLQFLPSSICL
jgi:hypothetical protein